MTDTELDQRAHESAEREARDCDVPECMDARSFAAGVYAFAYVTERARLATQRGPSCGHGVCSQNYIDTGDAACVVDHAAELDAFALTYTTCAVCHDAHAVPPTHPDRKAVCDHCNAEQP